MEMADVDSSHTQPVAAWLQRYLSILMLIAAAQFLPWWYTGRPWIEDSPQHLGLPFTFFQSSYYGTQTDVLYFLSNIAIALFASHVAAQAIPRAYHQLLRWTGAVSSAVLACGLG